MMEVDVLFCTEFREENSALLKFQELKTAMDNVQ
jgi:hypothetical protein